MWWVFIAANAIAAGQAQVLAFATLPPDTLFNGQIAPIQYTVRWGNVITLTDGRLAFRLKPGMITPGAVSVTMTDAQIAALLPVVVQSVQIP